MRTLALICNQCGAPIQAPESLRFVTCTHCNTPLKILSEGGGTYTELLEDIRETQVAVASNLDTIQLQNELERLDREWEATERSFERVDRSGRRKLPSMTSGGAGIAIGVLFVLFGVATAADSDVGMVLLLVLAGIAIAIVSIVRGFKEGQRFAEAKTRHRKRRGEILSQLSERGALHGEE